MKNKKETPSVELVLEGAELTDDAKKALKEQIDAIVTTKTDKNVAFILEQKLREAKVNIYKAVKAKAKEAFMEAFNLVRAETQNDAKEFKKDMTEKLSDYLDSTMNKLVPDSIIKEAAEAKHYKSLVNQVKEVIVIDEVTKDREVREAVSDANGIMKKLKVNNNKLMKEKIRMHKRCKEVEAELHLEKKMKGLTDSQKTFVTEALKGKEASEIDELFESTTKLMREKTEKKPSTKTAPKQKTVTDRKIIKESHQKALKTEARNSNPDSIVEDEMDYFVETVTNND